MAAHDPDTEPTVSPSAIIAGAVPASDGTQVQAQPPTHLFAPGTLPLVPGYAVIREIARGGMGVVYEAHDPTFDRRVAVKVMHRGQDAARFVVESKVTAQLPHPGVPPVYALGTLADGRPFLAMKLIAGETLSDGLTRTELPRLLGTFEQICLTIGFAHSRGIVHRDLKPSNVMIGAFGEVQVMDWGLAKSVTGGPDDDARGPLGADAVAGVAETVAGVVKGTPAYMAPEQARGERVDARADVFALGGILAVVLTGKPPFLAETVVDTVLMAAGAELSVCFALLDASGAEEDLVALAKRCLAAEAPDRPADGREVAAAVTAYRAGAEERLQRAERERAAAEATATEELNTRREAEARADAERARFQEQRKRRRVQLVLAGVVAVALAGAGVATALVIEQRSADRLAADQQRADERLAGEQQRADERVAAEQKLADERVAAEQKRQADLKAADDAARDQQRQTRAEALLHLLATTDTGGVRGVIADMSEFRDLTLAKLRESARQPVNTKPGLHARLVLLSEAPKEPSHLTERAVEELSAHLPTCRPDELLPICSFLKPHARAIMPGLWAVMREGREEPGRRLRAACACAALGPELLPGGAREWARLAPTLTALMTRVGPVEFVAWSAALEPVRGHLTPALLDRYPELRRVIEGGRLEIPKLVETATDYDLTADLLARYAVDRPRDLAELALIADSRHYARFAPALRDKKAAVVPLLTAELAKKPPHNLAVDKLDAGLDVFEKRRGYAAAALISLGEAEPVWPLFGFPTDGDPTARSYLQERLPAVGADPVTLVRRFGAEGDVSAKRALVIALGDFPAKAVPAREREPFVARLLTLYRDEPDAGLHSAIDWLLRQKWGKGKELAEMDAALAATARGRAAARAVADAAVPVGRVPVPVGPLLPAPRMAAGKDWFVNGEGQTFAVVRGPVEFMIGSPDTEPGRIAASETAHRKRIGRSFAIGTKEVTVAEFLRFRPNHDWVKRFSSGPDTPIVAVTWYDCAAYCNWLSGRAGVPEDQWCYERNKAGEYGEGMTMKAGHLGLTGYRLPTEVEWEYACRAGGTPARHFGRGEGLLPRYCWSAKNADERAWPVGQLRPNERGLFDMLGNAVEWVEDPGLVYTTDRAEDVENVKFLRIDERVHRFLRGGSFVSSPPWMRSATRLNNRPSFLGFSYGFRPVRTMPD